MKLIIKFNKIIDSSLKLLKKGGDLYLEYFNISNIKTLNYI